MVPEDIKQWYLSREPQDKTDEIIVELIEEIQALAEALKEANENTVIWKKRYQEFSSKI
jgi:hypothetical protein